MFQVNPIIYKIHSELTDIENKLSLFVDSDLKTIATQINDVKELIYDALNNSSISLPIRQMLEEHQSQLCSLVNRCNNLKRSQQFQGVLNSQVEKVRKEKLQAFKESYNLTIDESRQLYSKENKVVSLSKLQDQPKEFSEIVDQIYLLAVLIHRSEKGCFFSIFYKLPKDTQQEIEYHIKCCGGSLKKDVLSIYTIQALISYAEHYKTPIEYISTKEALEVVEDLDDIY